MRSNWKRWLGLVLAILVVGGGGYAGYRVWRFNQEYLSTDDAYIDGREIVIAAPASGKIVDWVGQVGATFPAGATVGDIEVQAGNSTSTVAIPVPENATIVQRSAVDGEYVAIGTPLAYAYDLNHLWVTANVKETDLRDVAIGAPVQIHVDAYPNLTLHGRVVQIQPATAATFSLIPVNSDTANFTKVTQVVPVRIAIQYSPLASLVPGMDVTVDIAKAPAEAALSTAR
ncbi:MAG: efflux RND transporter periplasmic adaptor subunit [Firmicutes bacterium]|nr:HlyD family secretion protein [Alicyclobacillaceae bacterium]MCL6497057.1 efflux RND transporter periplasmic adaptor subunit [Bacillota bacterium]